MINIIPEYNKKAIVVFVFKNNIFLFIYNMRKTTFDEFLDPNYFNISNFRLNTKVVIEMQVYLQNFKPKDKSSQANQKYLFKLVDIYKFYNVKVFFLSIFEKKQKEANK